MRSGVTVVRTWQRSPRKLTLSQLSYRCSRITHFMLIVRQIIYRYLKNCIELSCTRTKLHTSGKMNLKPNPNVLWSLKSLNRILWIKNGQWGCEIELELLNIYKTNQLRRKVRNKISLVCSVDNGGFYFRKMDQRNRREGFSNVLLESSFLPNYLLIASWPFAEKLLLLT